MADSPLAQSILEGNIPSLPSCPFQETQKILENLTNPLLLVSKDIKSEKTSDQFIATYKRYRNVHPLLFRDIMSPIIKW